MSLALIEVSTEIPERMKTRSTCRAQGTVSELFANQRSVQCWSQ